MKELRGEKNRIISKDEKTERGCPSRKSGRARTHASKPGSRWQQSQTIKAAQRSNGLQSNEQTRQSESESTGNLAYPPPPHSHSHSHFSSFPSPSSCSSSSSFFQEACVGAEDGRIPALRRATWFNGPKLNPASPPAKQRLVSVPPGGSRHHLTPRYSLFGIRKGHSPTLPYPYSILSYPVLFYSSLCPTPPPCPLGRHTEDSAGEKCKCNFRVVALWTCRVDR